MNSSNLAYREAYWKEDIHYKAHKRMLMVLVAAIFVALFFFAVVKMAGLMGSVGSMGADSASLFA